MAGETDGKKTPLSELEQSQEALRRSIEQTKALAEKSQRLLDQHRRQSDGGK